MIDNLVPSEGSESNEPATPEVDASALAVNYELMLKEIRSWGYWSLGLGVLHIVSSGFLNSAWGILLLIVGLASFYFRSASMFIIYTITLAWAAFSNLVSMNVEWMILAAVQIYFAFRTFKDFRRFSKIENKLINVSQSDINSEILTINKRSEKGFPWIGPLLGCSSVIICFATFFLAFFVIDEVSVQNMTYPAYYTFLTALMEIIAILGFAVSLASLISKHKPKLLNIAGSVIGGVLVLFLMIARIIFL